MKRLFILSLVGVALLLVGLSRLDVPAITTPAAPQDAITSLSSTEIEPDENLIAVVASANTEANAEVEPDTEAEINPDVDTYAEMATTQQQAQPASYCLECHSDAAMLQELAEEEPVTEKLSEGAG